MRKSLIVFITVIGSLFLFSGCWDQKLVEQTGFTLQLGVELSPENKLLLTSCYPAIDAKEKNRDEIITAEAYLLREARNKREATASKVIDGGKIQQLLFSKELATLGIQEIMEILERDPLNPPLSYVVIVDGSPKELLEKAQTFPNKPRVSLYIHQLLVNNINSAYTPETKTYDFFIRYFAPGLDPITPLIRLDTDGIRVLGSALFAGDKLVGTIDTQQTAFLLAMMGQFKKTELFFAPVAPQQAESIKKGLSLTNVQSRRKIRVTIENDRPVVDLALAFTASLVEYRRDGLDQPPAQEQIEEGLARQIKKACLEIIRYTQEIGSDPIGIGDLVRAKYPDYWQQVDWRTAYREAVVNLSVKMDLLQYGAIH
ncbi:Ger(x)C family spore germination protein [Capillibacterium thermochitinicola]|uniref:Ger(X)C family spore germination protein n=1 Tax=Capillibacterium thermochitinicola TaxID=2699427 RepID=A0A8J6I1R3_9FIRM|nr:Ger(x)C family spore germination protein [Capillibacterium thermochitinicola]MBA2132682.1 Ger(x)C family spore germination protein [Capillibacterium thermochitinicola]